MPKTITINGVTVDWVRVEWDATTQEVGLSVGYYLTDAAGTRYGAGTYTHTLTTAQKGAFRGMIVNNIIPAIKTQEGI